MNSKNPSGSSVLRFRPAEKAGRNACMALATCASDMPYCEPRVEKALPPPACRMMSNRFIAPSAATMLASRQLTPHAAARQARLFGEDAGRREGDSDDRALAACAADRQAGAVRLHQRLGER